MTEWHDCPNRCSGSATTEDLEEWGECPACKFQRDVGICPLCGRFEGACECEKGEIDD